MSSEPHIFCPYTCAHNTNTSYTQILRHCHHNSFELAHAVLLLQIPKPFCIVAGVYIEYIEVCVEAVQCCSNCLFICALTGLQ